MDEERTLIIGFDLCDDYSQIASYHKNSNEPESVCMTPDKSRYLIPTAVCIKEGSLECVIGEEAERCRDRKGGIYIDSLVTKMMNDEEVSVYDSVMTGTVLMEKFFLSVLGIIRQKFLNSSIKQMVITTKSVDGKLTKKLLDIMEKMGLGSDRVKILNHTMCFMYYTVHQTKDIWQNDVAMFDYDIDGMTYYQLSFGRKKSPIAIVAKQIEMSEQISYKMLEDKPIERLVSGFESLAVQTLHKKIISSLFITGRGFDGSWADGVLRTLCMGRRVFKGQNLYVKGAGYAAMDIANNAPSEFLFLAEDMIRTSIAMSVTSGGENVMLKLAEAGEYWYDINVKNTVILDSCSELEFVVNDALKKDAMREYMMLDGLVKRENKTMRLDVKLYFADRDTAVVKVNDAGFGAFYPTNYRVWEQILKI